MQFKPTIKYLPGKANNVANALSRNIPVAAVTQISNFSLSELRTAQHQDTLWFRVIYALESGDDSSLPILPIPFSDLLQDDVLCSTVTISKDVVTQLVIPFPLVNVVLRLLHDMPSAGHPGRDRTLAAARSKYYWPTMVLRSTSHSAFLVLIQKVLPVLPRFFNILFQLNLLTWLVLTFYSYLVAPKALSISLFVSTILVASWF